MCHFRRFLALCGVVAVFIVLDSRTRSMVLATDKDDAKEVKVAGILIAKTGTTLTVKADGEDEPVKYTIPKSDKKVTDALKTTFDACRVKLTYKNNGDERQLMGISRQVLKEKGTVTGTVVKVYNDFWVEVKPKDGVSDAYAPGGGNFKNKEFMDLLKGLKPGDSVTIKFTTDFERHRIETLKKNNPK